MTDTHGAAALTVDQQIALRQAAARLEREFTGTFGTETIERFLYSSYDQFASRATVAQFLPLLAERFARQRLKALARVEDRSDDGRPFVLFLCTHNAGALPDGPGLLPVLRRPARGGLVRRHLAG
jgi:hypothetical protein